MRRAALLAATCLSSLTFGQYTGLFPDGVAVSRGPMPGERALDARTMADPPSTPPPLGPVHCVAEYEPMDGLIMAWEGSAAQNNILAAMAKEFTQPDGAANVYMLVDTVQERDAVATQLQATGVDMNRVRFVVTTTDTIWCRDYGPRYVYQGGCRAIVKHTYNRNRPNDNLASFAIGNFFGQEVYQIPLIHGGGNMHLSALGDSYSTRLIANENPTKTDPQIVQLWKDYQNLDGTITDAYPTSVDSTQHIDMWMQIVGDRKVVISDWPLEPGSVQDNICDTTALSMQAQGYTVYRIPAFRSGGIHYTYTNIVVCNGVAFVPSFSVGNYNADALAVWQQALPDKRVVQSNCQALVTSAGVVHCVVMHVPKFLGQDGSPLAYCAAPNGGETLVPGGQPFKVRWAADDDKAVVSVDLLLSTDGGATFPSVVASGLAPNGDFDWTVPDIYAPQARLKVVAHDADGNQGSDSSDASFLIAGADTPTLTDLNVSRGQVLSGDLADLAAADQSYLLIERHNPKLPDPFTRPQIEFSVGAVTQVAKPATIQLTVVSKSVTPSTAVLSLKNWGSGQYNEVGTYTVGTGDLVKTYTGIPAGAYVRGDGRVEARVSNRQAAPYFSVYKSYFDQVQVKVRP